MVKNNFFFRKMDVLAKWLLCLHQKILTKQFGETSIFRQAKYVEMRVGIRTRAVLASALPKKNRKIKSDISKTSSLLTVSTLLRSDVIRIHVVCENSRSPCSSPNYPGIVGLAFLSSTVLSVVEILTRTSFFGCHVTQLAVASLFWFQIWWWLLFHTHTAVVRKKKTKKDCGWLIF